MKQIFFICFFIAFSQFTTYAQHNKPLEFSKEFITFALPENTLPFPFKIASGDSVKIDLLINQPLNEIPGTVYYNPAEKLMQSIGLPEDKPTIAALRFYLDTAEWPAAVMDTFILQRTLPLKAIKNNIARFFTPFYFKKSEVTNREYREFTNWVRDSIARSLLAQIYPDKYYLDADSKNLNWKTPIDWNGKDERVKEILESLYIPQNESFYMKRELDARRLVYSYLNENNDRLDISVYPDTLLWLTDNPYTFIENKMYLEMMRSIWKKRIRNYPYGIYERMLHYFHLEEYNDYPVTGVSYVQAKAYCYWKTKQIQKTLPPYANFKLEVDLPYDYEREYVMTNYSESVLPEANCICDLMAVKRPDFYPSIIDEILDNDYTVQSNNEIASFSTHPADLSKINPRKRALISTDIDEHNISGMHDNVSEWMNESYQSNWLPFISKREELLKSVNTKELDSLLNICSTEINPLDSLYINQLRYQFNIEIPQLLSLEKMFNSYCDVDGMLVRGGNWKDNRYIPDFHPEAVRRNSRCKDAMTFVSPTKSGSMLGFRYVVRIKGKN